MGRNRADHYPETSLKGPVQTKLPLVTESGERWGGQVGVRHWGPEVEAP